MGAKIIIKVLLTFRISIAKRHLQHRFSQVTIAGVLQQLLFVGTSTKGDQFSVRTISACSI
jgi:hypothetical protein